MKLHHKNKFNKKIIMDIKKNNWVNYDDVINILKTSIHKIKNPEVNWIFDQEIENELLNKLIKKMQTLKKSKKDN